MTESEPWSYHADGTPVTSLADVIRKRAAATPDGIALVRAGQVSTFARHRQPLLQPGRLAAPLRWPGSPPGDRVAFIGASGPEFAEVMYGTAKCGGIFTAVNNRLARPEVEAILGDAEPRVVVADAASAWITPAAAIFGFRCTVRCW